MSQQPVQITISRKARLWPEIPHETVTLPSPPSAPSATNATALITLVLSIAGVTVSGFLFSRMGGSQNLFIIAFIAMSAFAAVGSLITFIVQRMTSRRQTKYLLRAYKMKLREAEKQLLLLQQKEQQARIELDPPFVLLERDASGYEQVAVTPFIQRSFNEQDIYLWSRRSDDPDFLAVRIGMGSQPATFKVQGEEKNSISLPSVFDEMNEQAHSLLATYATLIAPTTVKLDEHSPVAIASTPYGLSQARELAHAIVSQLAYHHSPEDVRIIVLAPKSQEAQWQWASMLPHTLMYDPSQDNENSNERNHPPHSVAIGPEAIMDQLPLLSRELSRRENIHSSTPGDRG